MKYERWFCALTHARGARFSPTCNHRPFGKSAKPTTSKLRSHRILASRTRFILKCTGTRLEGGDLHIHTPLPLGRASRPVEDERTAREEEERRGKKELRGEARGARGRDQVRETRESTRWNLDEPRTKDEERPPREEWPTAMKILTGTMPGPRRPPESVFLLLFLSLSLSFFSSSSSSLSTSLPLTLLLPATVSLSSGTIYRGRVQGSS